jgi:cephalosporin-C deacetylase-like acetyl esterase
MAPKATQAPDFDAFWQTRLRDLAAVTPGYVVESKPDQSSQWWR